MGLITSEWERNGNNYTHHITIPVNTTAIVYIQGSDPARVYESGIPVLKSKEIQYLRAENNYLVYQVGSGSYWFSYGVPVKQTGFLIFEEGRKSPAHLIVN